MIFDIFEVELDKGATLETVLMGHIVTVSSSHLLQSLDNQLWKDAFKEDKLSLIVDFRSLRKKPRQDKQDFIVVEQYPVAPTSTKKRWTDQPLDFIEVLSGLYFSNIFWCQTWSCEYFSGKCPLILEDLKIDVQAPYGYWTGRGWRIKWLTSYGFI